MKLRYVIICLARNEEHYIRYTLSSVACQTIKPSEMIVVNDNSTDKTAVVVKEFITGNKWLRMIYIQDETPRELGARVANNFSFGLKHIKSDYDYLIKMDADISFQKDFFERIFQQFLKDKRLGISGGIIYSKFGDHLKIQGSSPKHNVAGAFKVYRKKCFEDIGGLIPILGWDHVDEMKARMLGWRTRHFRNMKIIQHRPMGSSIGNIYKGKMRWGETSYKLRNSIVFVLAKGIYHFFEPPYLIGGLAFYAGYINAAIRKKQRYTDLMVCKYLRKQQLRRLFGKEIESV